MPEITRRRTGEYLRILFDILSRHPDGVQAGEAIAAVAARLTLSPYELGEYESGGRRFEKILRFATVDCVKAGWLIKNKGLWTITPVGLKAFKELQDPEAFHREAFRLYHEWRRSQLEPEEPPIEGESPLDEEATDRGATVTFETAEEQAWREIETYLRGMNPYQFQDLVAALLRAMGYHVSWIAGPGKDGGLDIIAYPDPLGTQSPRIKVQVKRHSSSISVDGLRSFMSLLGEEDVGLFVTTSSFTKDAMDEARVQERRRVTLIDLERFFDLWVRYYDKLEDDARRLLPLKQLWFIAPQA